jgi:predicted enzyme related to lactoylglutathione lyase
MTCTAVLAQSTVADLRTAEPWYTAVLEREPDARPMDGLLEWHLTAGGGLQVWAEPERAGRGTVVLVTDDDLHATAARLAASGLAPGGPEEGGGARVLRLTDPDGNRVVVVGR